MSRTINRTPLRDALTAAGVDVEGRMLYQDYLNIVAGGGLSFDSIKPMSEEQWEQMCDMLGSDRPLYASTVKSMIANATRKRQESQG